MRKTDPIPNKKAIFLVKILKIGQNLGHFSPHFFTSNCVHLIFFWFTSSPKSLHYPQMPFGSSPPSSIPGDRGPRGGGRGLLGILGGSSSRAGSGPRGTIGVDGGGVWKGTCLTQGSGSRIPLASFVPVFRVTVFTFFFKFPHLSFHVRKMPNVWQQVAVMREDPYHPAFCLGWGECPSPHPGGMGLPQKPPRSVSATGAQGTRPHQPTTRRAW